MQMVPTRARADNAAPKPGDSVRSLGDGKDFTGFWNERASCVQGLADPKNPEFGLGPFVASSQVRVEEFGTSGVTRMRAQFQLVPTTAGFTFWGWADKWQSDWLYTQYFPDDATNKYINWWVNYPYAEDGSVWRLQVDVVWERPGFWNQDVEDTFVLATCGSADNTQAVT